VDPARDEDPVAVDDANDPALDAEDDAARELDPEADPTADADAAVLVPVLSAGAAPPQPAAKNTAAIGALRAALRIAFVPIDERSDAGRAVRLTRSGAATGPASPSARIYGVNAAAPGAACHYRRPPRAYSEERSLLANPS
jgi:hypothetical protein